MRIRREAVEIGREPSPRRRRRWATEEKRRIVEATFVPGASIAEVALTHGVNANQVHAWRRLHRRGLLSGSESAALLPVRVVRDERSIPVVHLDANSSVPYQASRPRRTRPAGLIQIELERGRLRVEGTPDPVALRMVLECLLG